MGRQYVRQSFSSASCAAGDSPCASSTTLQCVVANTVALFSRLRPVGPIPLPEAPPSSVDTAAIQVKNHSQSKIVSGHARIQIEPTHSQPKAEAHAIKISWQRPGAKSNKG